MTRDTDSTEIQTAESAPGNGRVQRWVNKRFQRWVGRGLLGGLGSTLMALPALAQATDGTLDAFQFAEAIAGVRSAKLLPSGDVQLKMMNGRTLIVSTEDVHILDNGAIMIADDAAMEIAQFAAAAEAAAATAAGGGVSGAGLALGGLGVAGAAAAAGGGGGGGESDSDDDGSEAPATPSAPRPPSLNLAELQSNALNDSSAQTATPDGTVTVEVAIGSLTKTVTPAPDGSWSVSLSQSEAAALPQGVSDVTVRHLDGDGVELSIGTAQFDVDTIPPTLSIDAFSHGAVLNAAEQGANMIISGATDAENGQSVTVTADGQTYTGVVAGGSWSVTVPAADLAGLSDGTTISVTADISDRAGNPAAQASNSFETDFSAPALTLNPVAGGSIDLIDVSSDLVLNGTTTAEDGQQVAVTFNGRNYTGVASGGSWVVTIPSADLAGLSTGTPASVEVAVSDSAGNPATPVTATVPVDLTGPSIAIDPLSVGTVLNAAEAGSDLVVTGTVGNITDGQLVTVTLDGESYSGAVSSGTWSVTIPSADLEALTDGGTFTVTADAADTDGLNAPQAGRDLTKDTSAPTLSIDAFSAGAVMNAVEQGSDLLITGTTTAEDDQTLTLNFEGQPYTGIVSGGAWSISIPSADLVALSDGATINVTADVSDVAGNPAVQASGSFDTDFSAPTLVISALSGGAVLNASEQASGLTISGSSDAADGTQLSVEVRHPDGSIETTGTTTVNAGSWSYTTAAGDLSGLLDGVTYQVNASVSDAAGNTASANTSFDTDLSAPTITLNTLPTGSKLDVIEQGSDLQVSGSTTAEDSQIVTINLNGQDYSATVANGAWVATIPAADLSVLADATAFTLTASVQDAAGNAASDATTTLTTDFRPILSMDSVGINDALVLGDLQATGTAVTGSSVGLAAGQVVMVALNGAAVGSTTVAADGSWSLNVPAAQFAAIVVGDSLNFEAQASVSGGQDPEPASDEAVAYVPSAYVITEAGRSGSTVTFEVYAEPDRDVSGGLSFTGDLSFDSTVVSYDSGSEVENPDFTLFLTNPQSASLVSFAGAATSFGDLSQPLMTFTMTVQDAARPIVLSLTTPDGGPSRFHLGTDGTDILTATDLDDILRGGDGDDAIDLSGAVGRDVVMFEASPADNGADTITGFTLGPAAEVTDAIMFAGLDVSTLRGDGTGIENLNVGDAIGQNTGFVGLQTTLSDLDTNTIAAAAENLTGAQAGDELYLLATDGTDSLLVKVGYSGSDTAAVQAMAQFDGLADLSGLTDDNILLTDPTGAGA